MKKSALRLFVVVLLSVGLFAAPAAAQDQGSDNLVHVASVPPASSATQSDLAFWGRTAVAGSYDGFRLIDIKDPTNPSVIAQVWCNGAQGDVSIYEDLVFRSVDAPQSSTSCDSTGVTASTPGMFEGVQIFDISDPTSPELIHSVPTDCGSHTHTLVPDADNDRVFIYVASYPLGASALGPNCVRAEDGGGHNKISIIEVPLNNPQAATVSPYFLDDGTEWATYLGAYTLRACHDISVFTAVNLAAAACMSEGQLWDISNPAEPEFVWRYDNPAIKPENVDLFHSAAFTWDGKVVGFGDESGGGGAARCVDPDDDQGRVWFVDVETGAELASYKFPRSIEGTCTMHNFNFIPQRRGVYTMISSGYTAGTTVVDVNKLLAGASEAESEIAWATRDMANTWSSYWYNNYIYASDHHSGMDVFRLDEKVRVKVRQRHSNPQTQEMLLR